MSSTKEMEKIVALIRKSKKFVTVAHESPDGDSLGSALAMACALKKLKKDVCVMTDMVPEKYRYLPLLDKVSATAPKDLNERVVMLFDTPTLERLGSLEPLVSSCPLLVNVDHHVSNSRYGTMRWIDVTAAAVGEQVYDLIKRLGVKLDKNIAACLYTSLVTDTGKFQYSNTTQRTHRVAADLLATGINHTLIHERIYEDYPKEKLAMLSGALADVHLEFGGKVGWVVVTQQLLKASGSTLEWCDDIINHVRGISGVEVAAVFKESDEPGSFKVSFRSRNPKIADVNVIARKFSGGGHSAASGCNMEGTGQEVSQKVLAELEKIYGKV